MAEKKSQTLVRAEAAELSGWKEAALIRGLSLNQWLVEAANRSLTASVTAVFKTSTGSSDTTSTLIMSKMADPLLAYDLALNQTPTLTGQRKWVDPQALRDEFEKLLKDEVVAGTD